MLRQQEKVLCKRSAAVSSLHVPDEEIGKLKTGSTASRLLYPYFPEELGSSSLAPEFRDSSNSISEYLIS